MNEYCMIVKKRGSGTLFKSKVMAEDINDALLYFKCKIYGPQPPLAYEPIGDNWEDLE